MLWDHILPLLRPHGRRAIWELLPRELSCYLRDLGPTFVQPTIEAVCSKRFVERKVEGCVALCRGKGYLFSFCTVGVWWIFENGLGENRTSFVR